MQPCADLRKDSQTLPATASCTVPRTAEDGMAFGDWGFGVQNMYIHIYIDVYV